MLKPPDRIEFLQGTLDMLILQTLCRGKQHGYGISQSIRTGSADTLQLETGSLYPALHRLEKRGWIESEWKTSDNNQRAKYYQLTAKGRKQLSTQHARWTQFVDAVSALMKPRSA